MIYSIPYSTFDAPDLTKPVICYQNAIYDAAVTGSGSFVAGFPRSAIITYPTWEGARPTNPAAWNATFALAASSEIDYLAFAAIEPEEGAPAFLIGLEYSTDGSSYSTIIDPLNAPEYLDITNNPTVVRFAAVTAAFIRVTFGDVAFVGNMMAGKATELERNLYVGHSPASLNRRTVVTGATSENGQYLGRIVRSELARTSVDLQNITPEYARETLYPFFRAARTQPFYFAWRPQSYPWEIIYGWMDGDPEMSNQRPNGMMSATFRIEGQAGEPDTTGPST